MVQEAQADLKGSVLRALSTVTDPELDEPITDLGFVKELSVSDDGRVSLDLVTSTFWCSPNFVYMMLEEARDVVAKLEGITEVRGRILASNRRMIEFMRRRGFTVSDSAEGAALKIASIHL